MHGSSWSFLKTNLYSITNQKCVTFYLRFVIKIFRTVVFSILTILIKTHCIITHTIKSYITPLFSDDIHVSSSDVRAMGMVNGKNK